MEAIFDLPEERLIIGPAPGAERLRTFLEENPNIVIDEDCADLLRLDTAPHERRRMRAYTVRRGKPFPTIERAFDARMRAIQPWMLVELLRVQFNDAEGAFERGGYQNLFWIPQPIIVYEETTDGKLYVKRFKGNRLERFAKVFVGDLPGIL